LDRSGQRCNALTAAFNPHRAFPSNRQCRPNFQGFQAASCASRQCSSAIVSSSIVRLYQCGKQLLLSVWSCEQIALLSSERCRLQSSEKEAPRRTDARFLAQARTLLHRPAEAMAVDANREQIARAQAPQRVQEMLSSLLCVPDSRGPEGRRR